MATPKDLPRDIGTFIRDLRRNAQISLRQLANQAGVSNPYLSQVERGLRKPSAEVLQQLASALRVSTPMMYLRAGLLDPKDGAGVLAAISADPELTVAQKQSLIQIYETFRRENTRTAAPGTSAGEATERTEAGPEAGAPAEPARAAGETVESSQNAGESGETTRQPGGRSEPVAPGAAAESPGATGGDRPDSPARSSTPVKKVVKRAARKAAGAVEKESR